MQGSTYKKGQLGLRAQLERAGHRVELKEAGLPAQRRTTSTTTRAGECDKKYETEDGAGEVDGANGERGDCSADGGDCAPGAVVSADGDAGVTGRLLLLLTAPERLAARDGFEARAAMEEVARHEAAGERSSDSRRGVAANMA